MSTTITKIKHKRGTQTQLDDGILLLGEFGFATDTKQVFIGNGVGKTFVGKAYIDTLANRPSAGILGRFFYATDTKNLYLDLVSVWEQLTNNYGAEKIFTPSLVESNTDSTSYIEKLKMTTGSLTGGTYKFSWYYKWKHDNNSYYFMSRLQLDDTVDVSFHKEMDQDSGTGQILSESGFAYLTLSSGNHTIDLDYATSNALGTSYISNVNLELIKIS